MRGPRPKPAWDRIAPRLARNESGCWVWTGASMSNGYGVVQLANPRRVGLVHRVVYEHHRGLIPAGLEIDHVCRVRLCANPDHLRAVTRRENTLAAGSLAVAKAHADKTHCKNGHEFTAENTYLWKGKYRICRACSAARQCARSHGGDYVRYRTQ